MANPQPDRFTRISNELFEAIMQTDFSKRQRNILDLIIRVSYGCGKKFAYLRPSDFEVVGVYKSHIKKELDYLTRAKVIFRDGERISLNKDYDQWRVSLNKIFNQDKLIEILRRNLSGEVTKTVTNTTDDVTKTVTKVTKTVTENCPEDKEQVTKTVTDGYQNSNSEVTKTVTDTPPSIPINTNPEGGLKKLKERSKETTTNILSTGTRTPELSSQESLGGSCGNKIYAFYENNIGLLSPLVVEKLDYWVADTEEALVLYALEKAVLAGKRNFSYTEGILKNWTSQGLRTRKGAELAEQEFRRQKEHSQRLPPGAAKKREPPPLSPEEKKRIEIANAKLRELTKQIGKEMSFP